MQSEGAHKLIMTNYCFYSSKFLCICEYSNKKKVLTKQLNEKTKSVCGSFVRSDRVPYGYDRAHRYVLHKSPKFLAVPQVFALGLAYAYMCQRTCVRAPQFYITTTTAIIRLCYDYFLLLLLQKLHLTPYSLEMQ